MKKVFVFFDQRTRGYVVAATRPDEKQGVVYCGMTGAGVKATLFHTKESTKFLGEFEINRTPKFNDVRFLQTMLEEVELEEMPSVLHKNCSFVEKAEDGSLDLFYSWTSVREEWDDIAKMHVPVEEISRISYLGEIKLGLQRLG